MILTRRRLIQAAALIPIARPLIIPAKAQLLQGIAGEGGEGTNGGATGFSLKSRTYASGSGPFTSPPIDTTGADLIIVTIGTQSSFGVLSDTYSNTFLLAVSQNWYGTLYIYYAQSPSVGAGHTFSVSNPGNWGNWLTVSAWSGSATSPVDKTSTSHFDNNTSYQPGLITGVENELVITAVQLSNTGTGCAVNDSFVADIPPSGGQYDGGGSAYLISTVASLNPTWSWNTATAGPVVIASFKAQ